MASPEARTETAAGGAGVLSVILPAYNEEDAIGAVLERLLATEAALQQAGLARLEVIVVDDGSSDGTRRLVEQQARVTLICHEHNRGYGGALKTGFRLAQGEFLAFLDADGTYPPEALPALCRPLLEGRADLVIGCRMAGADSRMPAVRRLGNLLFAGLLTVLGNHPVRDSASGMRVFRREALPLLYPLPDGLNFTPVMSARALHEGMRVVEVPISYEERVGESKLRPLRDGLRFLRSIMETVLSYNPMRPLGILGLAGIGLALTYFLVLVGVRLSGVTYLGTWGTLGVFAALVMAVAGTSLLTLGETFNRLVALFHRRPVRQGLWGRPILPAGLERHFGWMGLGAILVGVVLAGVCTTLTSYGWPLLRLWLYLVGSAGAILIGVQLLISRLLVHVLTHLSHREEAIEIDLNGGDR